MNNKSIIVVVCIFALFLVYWCAPVEKQCGDYPNIISVYESNGYSKVGYTCETVRIAKCTDPYFSISIRIYGTLKGKRESFDTCCNIGGRCYGSWYESEEDIVGFKIEKKDAE